METLSKRDRFYEVAPEGAFFLDTEVASLDGYLRGRGWLESGELVTTAEIAGQGNMNYIVRVTTDVRTFILKQARPWVEKYPEIAAPFDRALIEAEFYRLVNGTPAADCMPKLYWDDEEARILCLEDLGTLGDFTNIYDGTPIRGEELGQLCRLLSVLHSSSSDLARSLVCRDQLGSTPTAVSPRAPRPSLNHSNLFNKRDAFPCIVQT